MNIHTYFWTCTFLNQNWADRKENVPFFSVVGPFVHLWFFLALEQQGEKKPYKIVLCLKFIQIAKDECEK